MLDVSRHYMPTEEIRRLLDAAKLLGLNRMHWHLTDDQGWRIEIRKYPRLTEAGSVRGDSWFGGTAVNQRNCGYYTQREIRDLVAYAGGLGIDIIPEIEIPGHASALLTAYPEFGCRRGENGRWQNRVEISGGIFPGLICAGKDSALDFLKEILDEVMELFPFPAVHIGGDEALKLRWRRCPDCRRRMAALGLPSEDALQRWLVMRIGEYLAAKGRRTIVWGDVLAGGMLPNHFIVQQWLGMESETRAFLAGGGQVIRSATDCFYLDYSYGLIDVRTIWETPRIPDYARGYEDGLLGIECPLWTERIPDLSRAAYQLFPRLTAAACRMNEGDMPWDAFRNRVAELTAEITRRTGLKPAPESLWDLSPEEAARERETEDARIRIAHAPASIVDGTRLPLLEDAERLAEAIGIPEAFVIRAGDSMLAELYHLPVPEDDDGAGKLIRQLMAAVSSRKWGEWSRIPEDIWLATMKCFPRYISEYHRAWGRDGFDRYGWTVRQINARLFRIGELEYELEDREGQREISLHVPSDAHLEPEPLNESLRRADAFLREYFPDWAELPRTCDSWLLSPVLRELLPSSSGILRFQQAFDLRAADPESDAALEWVFHVAHGQRAGLNPAALPEQTTLQRRMKALILAGRLPGSASGVLSRSF